MIENDEHWDEVPASDLVVALLAFVCMAMGWYLWRSTRTPDTHLLHDLLSMGGLAAVMRPLLKGHGIEATKEQRAAGLPCFLFYGVACCLYATYGGVLAMLVQLAAIVACFALLWDVVRPALTAPAED